jgi:hypothetical protein
MRRKRERFYLDPEDDADIIRWLKEQDNKSAAIRAAIRQAIHPRENLDELKLRQVLRDELSRAQVTVAANGDSETSPSTTEDVDPEAGKLLDAMF